MYKHGKPIYRFSRLPLLIISILFIAIIAGTAFAINVRSKNTLKNNSSPLVSTVKVSQQNTPVDEPGFRMTLPGKWSLASTNWDARYHAWQWESHDKTSAGRWFRVYQDTIPSDYAYNFILPVSASGDGLETGQMSGNCADFTTAAQTSTNMSGTIAAVSKWQGVSFLCDYGNQNHQVVGISSTDGVNEVILNGHKGTHKFFFLYQDNNFSPDYGVIINILGSFHAK